MKKKYLTALVLTGLLLAGCAPQSPASGGSSSSSGTSASQPDISRQEPEIDTSSGVRVDWSRLEDKTQPQPDVDGGRWYPDTTDHLVTGADYGTLVPYLGAQAYSFNRWEYEGETQEYFSEWPTSFYGLMTREGKIVVDPVYQSAWSYSYYWRGETRTLPVLLLARSGPDWTEFGTGMRYAVAAGDGSWTTDFEFLNYTNKEDRLFLLRPEGCTVLDSKTGARRDWSWAELGIGREELPDMLEYVQWVVGLTWLDEGVCLGRETSAADGEAWEKAQVRIFQPETGEVSWVELAQWDRWYGSWSERRWPSDQEIVQQEGRTGLLLEENFYPLEGASENEFFSSNAGDLVLTSEMDTGAYKLYRLSTGELLRQSDTLELISDPARPERPVVLLREQGSWQLYDAALQPLLTLPFVPSGDWVSTGLQDGLLSLQIEGAFFGCYDLDAGRYVFFRNLGLGD